jgi:hypothetical protein
MKKILILFGMLAVFVAFLVFLMACTEKQDGLNESANAPVNTDLENRDVMLSYGEGNLSYVIVVEKPNSCYTLDAQKTLSKTVPQNVDINIIIVMPEKAGACSQAAAYEIVSGNIPVDAKPGRVTVRLNDAPIYSSASIKDKVGEKFCRDDYDCVCGRSIAEGNCAYGNRDSINTAEQCPDFCVGIAGNLEIKCVNSECMQQKKE